MHRIPILLLIALLFATTAFTAEKTLNIYKVVDQASADTQDFPVKDSSETLHVLKTPIITATDIVGGQIPDEESFRIVFTLTPQGREKFAKFTKGSTDNRFAVLMDGKLIPTPVVKQDILEGRITIDAEGIKYLFEDSIKKTLNPAIPAGTDPLSICKVMDKAGPDTKDETVPVGSSMEVIHISKTPTLTAKDVASAKLLGSSAPEIDITFTEEGKAKFAQLTKESINNKKGSGLKN